MGCGFCCVVPASDADAASSCSAATTPARAVIGASTETRRRRRAARRRPQRPSRRGLPRRIAGQASSQSQPVSTRVGLTRHSAARRHSSAWARGPGRSQTASTSAVAMRPKRRSASGSAGGAAVDGVAPGRHERRAPVLVGLLAEDPVLGAVVAQRAQGRQRQALGAGRRRRHRVGLARLRRDRRARAPGRRRRPPRSRASRGRSGSAPRRARPRAPPPPALSGVSSLRRKQMSPSRSARR